MSKEVVIFCQSYPQIKNTLYLLTNNFKNRPITLVIPGNHDLFKFFSLINEKLFDRTIKVIYIERYQRWARDAGKIIRILKAIPGAIGGRRFVTEMYRKHFAALQGAEIYFFSRHFIDYTFNWLRRLKEKNRLVYIPDPAMNGLVLTRLSPWNILNLALLGIIKLTFGRGATMYEYLGQKIVSLPDRFIEKEVDVAYSQEERDEMLRELDISRFQIFSLDDYDIIYFDHAIDAAQVPPDILTRNLTEVFNILGKYFPEQKIARKYHPAHYVDRAAISVGVILEDFIPAEFLHGDKVKMYISLFSTSITNRRRGLSVALIDLLPFKDAGIKQGIKRDLLRRSETEILFPQTLKEFEAIVAEAKLGDKGVWL